MNLRMHTLLNYVLMGLVAIACFGPLAAEDLEGKARDVVEAAIKAMGGQEYLQVKTMTSEGRYFRFSKGRKAFTRFHDSTVYQPPVKSRFQVGKGKRQTVWVYNMELNKGWKLEGESDLEEVTQQDLEDFTNRVKLDLDYLLRHRLDEEGVKLFYYGADEVAGSGRWEAVEVLDATNDSVIIFFDRDTHLPAKYEYHFTDRLGIRHKEEIELYNWHEFNGVQVPLNLDSYIDGELTQQRFLEQVALNPAIPPDIFQKPVIKPKKEKKKKRKQ